MLPAPDAARVFAFLGIAFSSCICYDWRAVGYQFAAPYNRPRCCNTGGGFYFLRAVINLFSALNGLSTNSMFFCNSLSRPIHPFSIRFRNVLILSTSIFVANRSSDRLFLRLVLPTNQICLLRIGQVFQQIVPCVEDFSAVRANID